MPRQASLSEQILSLTRNPKLHRHNLPNYNPRQQEDEPLDDEKDDGGYYFEHIIQRWLTYYEVLDTVYNSDMPSNHADLDSPEFAIYTDLSQAINNLDEPHRTVVKLWAAGFKDWEITQRTDQKNVRTILRQAVRSMSKALRPS